LVARLVRQRTLDEAPAEGARTALEREFVAILDPGGQQHRK